MDNETINDLSNPILDDNLIDQLLASNVSQNQTKEFSELINLDNNPLLTDASSPKFINELFKDEPKNKDEKESESKKVGKSHPITGIWDRILDKSNKETYQYWKHLSEKTADSVRPLNPSKQAIGGRDIEMDMLEKVLERPHTPVALLLGDAGVGKTALVEGFARESLTGKRLKKYLILELRLGALSALSRGTLQSVLSNILKDIYELQTIIQKEQNDDNLEVVLFIDEIHMLITIFGVGTKIGGDVMKDLLARSPIRVIGATTKREYDAAIAVDIPLAERFKKIELLQLKDEKVLSILKDWWLNFVSKDYMIDESVLKKLIEVNKIYRPEAAEPRKSLDILEDFASLYFIKRQPIDESDLAYIFDQRFSINLDRKFDAPEIVKKLEERIIGQPFALYTLKRLLNSMEYQFSKKVNQPMLTALFTGPTGVGKTETTKVIAEGLYPNENALFTINMPDYKNESQEPQFRKVLGNTLRHRPNSIILLDEFEKAHESIRDSMLTILDEGLIYFESQNREGQIEIHQASLRNSIVIATTNAGADVFANDTKFSEAIDIKDNTSKEISEKAKANINQLMNVLVPNLQAAGFRPEMLGRFQQIIPYKGLSTETLLKIAENKINKIVYDFKTLKQIDLIIEEPHQWPKDTYNYFTTDIALFIVIIKAKSLDSNSGGARAIYREIEANFMNQIIDAIIENPDCKQFKVEVNKSAAIYQPQNSLYKGIEVTPVGK